MWVWSLLLVESAPTGSDGRQQLVLEGLVIVKLKHREQLRQANEQGGDCKVVCVKGSEV